MPEPLQVVPVTMSSPIAPGTELSGVLADPDFSTSSEGFGVTASADDEIVVTGHRLVPWNSLDMLLLKDLFADVYLGGVTFSGSGGGGGVSVADSAAQEVKLNLPQPLTPEQQAAVDALIAKLAELGLKISSLSDTDRIALSNGKFVTGAELKLMWANLDFVINPALTSYLNGSNRGQANYNSGDPVVSVNIDVLVGYHKAGNGVGGLDYLVLHELAHMTAAGRASTTDFRNGRITGDQDERFANDIAHALANDFGLSIIANPGGGYSDTIPLILDGSPLVSVNYELDLPLDFVRTTWNTFLSLNDFSGDHRSDVLGQSSVGVVSYQLGGSDGGVEISGGAFGEIPSTWKIVGTGDFNRDGRTDILWRHESGVVSNWLATVDGFASNDSNVWHNSGLNWKVVGVGDFNRDGLADILWREDSGALSNWLGTAAGGFVSNDANVLYNVSNDWKVAATGDFNGDGYSDILWRNDNGLTGNWLANNSGTFTVNDPSLVAVATSWHVIGTGDFNGDGRSDILWRNDAGSISTWLGTPTGNFIVNDAIAWHDVSLDWHVVDIGDFNGDGRDDILWRSDSNWIGNWLGTVSGGFINNDANSLMMVDAAWSVVAPDVVWM